MSPEIPPAEKQRLKEDVALAVLHAQLGEPLLGYRLLDVGLSLAEDGTEPWHEELAELYRHALVAFALASGLEGALPVLSTPLTPAEMTRYLVHWSRSLRSQAVQARIDAVAMRRAAGVARSRAARLRDSMRAREAATPPDLPAGP